MPSSREGCKFGVYDSIKCVDIDIYMHHVDTDADPHSCNTVNTLLPIGKMALCKTLLRIAANDSLGGNQAYILGQ